MKDSEARLDIKFLRQEILFLKFRIADLEESRKLQAEVIKKLSETI